MLVKLSFGIFFVLVLTHVFKLVDKFGFLRYHHRHHPGTCRTIPGVLHGAEDFAVTTQGDVFITTGLVWRLNSPTYTAYSVQKNITGGILLFQFSKPKKGVTPLTLKPSPSFNPNTFVPHGIDLIEDNSKGEVLLFIVSHPENLPDRIEKFRFLPQTNELEHLKTYASQKFKVLNDVAVLGPDSFYTTNMCSNVERIPIMVEMLLLFKWGSVLFHRSDGEVVEAAPGLFQPNGITLTKDKRSVFVSAGEELHLYTRHDNGSLTHAQQLSLRSQLDNIQSHRDGRTIYIGSHPELHKFLEAEEYPEEKVAPSQVLAVPLSEDGRFEEKGVTELFYDHGDLISGSSVAAVFDGKMLIGTVQNKLAYCDISRNE